ncbi:hypothetical protein BS17DRAFT_813628 [Gyrodon lividus]|nr:hypothetical protein BS17DRAFT_813628 [Gyrodon lividus]
MPGVDLPWERIRCLYEYELAKRAQPISTQSDFSPEEQLKANRLFEPGDIAHVNRKGGVSLSFLQSRGYKLSTEERPLKYAMEDIGESMEKYCLVFERLATHKYIVCYITSFRNIVDPEGLSPSAVLFSIGMGDTPFYSSGVQPLRIVPSRVWHGFVYRVPVIREELKKVKHGRYFADFGELDRIKLLIKDRLKISNSFSHLCMRIFELRNISGGELAEKSYLKASHVTTYDNAHGYDNVLAPSGGVYRDPSPGKDADSPAFSSSIKKSY